MAKPKEKEGNVESQFAAVLSEAARIYADSSGEKLDDFKTPPMKSVGDLKRQLDLQNNKFTSFREKRQIFFSSLDKALRPIEVVGEVVAGAAEDAFPPTQGIFGAVVYLLSAAHDVSSMYDSIIELFDQLKDFTSRLDIYVQHQLSPALRSKLVAILACLFGVLVVATREVRRGRLKAYFKRLISTSSPVQSALENLQVLTVGEERQVIAETYGGVSQLNTKTDRVEGLISQVNDNIISLRSETRERENAVHQDRLKEILQPSPFPEDFYISFNKSRVKNTGNWVLEDEGWKSWVKAETRYLLISGGAGTGKSFLTARLVSWASEELPYSAYFFFRANNPETRSVLQALRDVAYQLSETDAFYAKQLLGGLSSIDEIKTIPSAFRKLLIQPFEEDLREKTIHVFLDGIDEAEPEEIEELLQQLADGEEDGQQPGRCKIQVVLTGRSYMTETVTFALDPLARGSQVLRTLHITPERSSKDVHSFIVNAVFQSRNLRRTSLDFKWEVIEAMEKQVDGLFILAKLMLEEINRKRHPRTILQSLASYPKEISGVLLRSLNDLSETISEDEADDLNEMLSWVTCAEESLTLGQLEAALVLKMGDPPFRLEETLRNQYACFFELEREDGLRTSDLIKEHERRRRRGDRSTSPLDRLGAGNGTNESKSNGRLSPGVLKSSSKELSSSRSPGRQSSPGSSPDSFDLIDEMQFRSNKATTFVTFFHTSVKEFFSSEDTVSVSDKRGCPQVGVDPNAARLHVLKTCLRIFLDKKWFEEHDLGDGRMAVKQHCAWYWQEILSKIEPSRVPAAERRSLGPQLYKMLTDEQTILEWSIMYEKNDEGLGVLTDSNIRGLQKWMADPEVSSGLDPEAKAWIAKATTQSPGIFEPIGRVYAKAWVSEDFHRYIPTRFCFEIVQSVAYFEAGFKWSTNWSSIPVEERIYKAAAWSQYKETAHYHRRVGSTLLTQNLHDLALQHYSKALGLDNNAVETNGRIAYCLWRQGRYQESLKKSLECERMEEQLQRGKIDEAALASSKWRLYKDLLLVGQCFYSIGHVQESLEYFRKAIKSASSADLKESEIFESEVRYLEVLCHENRQDEIASFLREMSQQLTNTVHGYSRLVDFIVAQAKASLIIDWLPRAVSKAGQAGFFVEHLETSIEVANSLRDSLKVLYLRLSLGATCAYSRNSESAIAIFEQISLNEYRPRGNLPTRQGYALSFQKLAILYKERILHAGIKTPEAQAWVSKLEQVHKLQNDHQSQEMPSAIQGSDVNLAAIFLALFYRLEGRKGEAHSLLQSLILDSLRILSDDEPQNDEYGLDNLLCLLIAADDIANARALSQSMRKVNPEVSIKTPPDSPVLKRAEPKLPEIQSADRSCAQCLEHISHSEDYHACQLCLESFCAECFKNVIKQDKNKTADRRSDVICRSDHAWFVVPPLDRALHHGEILLGDGKASNFQDWKLGLKMKWMETPSKK